MTIGHYGPTTEEAKRFIRKMNKWADELVAKPGAAKEFLVKHGFVTKSGKLTKRYR
jgi:hypothetical protein